MPRRQTVLWAGRLQELLDDIFDVLTDIAGLGECRGVRHSEGHVENARQQELKTTRRRRALSAWGLPDRSSRSMAINPYRIAFFGKRGLASANKAGQQHHVVPDAP